MKRILLVSAACLAFSAPAMAQTNAGQSDSQQSKYQHNPSSQSEGRQQTRMIRPSQLSKAEIREIQMNLNKAGFDAKNVDGIWGAGTREAVANFQKVKKLPGDGELNQQTLAALGVNLNTNQAQSANSDNKQAGVSQSSNQPGSNEQGSQTVGQAKSGSSSQQNGATGQGPSPSNQSQNSSNTKQP